MKTKYMYLTLLLAAFGFNAVIFSAAAPAIEETPFNGPQIKQTLIARGVPSHVSQEIVQQLNNLNTYPITTSDIHITFYGPERTFQTEHKFNTILSNISRIIERNNIDQDIEGFIISAYNQIRRNKNAVLNDLIELTKQQISSDEEKKRAR